MFFEELNGGILMKGVYCVYNRLMQTIIETDRLFLREFSENDYQDLCEILQDKDVMYAYDHPFSDDEVKSWYKNLMIDHYKKHGFGLWVIIHKETKELLGQCGLTIQTVNGEDFLEIGYHLKKKHWHKGYAAEAALGCKKYAFEILKAPRVYSIIRDDNIASQNVAKRIGMEKIREEMKHYSNKDVLHYIYGIDNRVVR
jgi:RimJ/RimL family protein N-acetyltransferase